MTLEAQTEDTTPGSSSDETAAPNPHRRPRPILMILHQEQSTPAHIGQTFVRHGHKLDIRKPRFGDELPKTLADHDGAVIFGGPMSANDNGAFLSKEVGLIDLALREEKPFLGVCLGAQMLARHLGARVFRDPYARAEIGYHHIQPHAPPAYGVPWPKKVYQWHREGFDLPTGANLLASTNGPYPCQAFQYGSGVAIQFHPEIMYTQVNRWSGNTVHRLMLPGAQKRPEQLADHIAHAPAVQRWLDAYLRSWVAMGVRD